MTDILTVQGVHGYVDNDNIVYLKVGDIAKGLGIITITNGKTYIHSAVLKKKLADINYDVANIDEDSYIDESVYQRLAMTIKNDSGRDFHIKMVEKIIPAMHRQAVISLSECDLAECIRDVGYVASSIKDVFGTDSSTAFKEAISLVESNNRINLNSLRNLVVDSSAQEGKKSDYLTQIEELRAEIRNNEIEEAASA